jgi:hypothetical protein
MGMVQEWSKQYGIEESFMAELHTGDTLHLLYSRPDVIRRMLQVNSCQLQQWLGEAPAPSRHVHSVGIHIGWLLANESSFSQVFTGLFHPKVEFEHDESNIATWFFDKKGTNYFGPEFSASSPPYAETTGTGNEGLRKAIGHMSGLIQQGYFVYQLAFGDAYDHRRGSLAGHRDVGVGGWVLWYSITGRYYDPTSAVHAEKLSQFWNPKERRTLDAQIRALNRKFFRKKGKD